MARAKARRSPLAILWAKSSISAVILSLRSCLYAAGDLVLNHIMLSSAGMFRLACLIFVFLAAPLHADTVQHRFDLQFRGLTVAHLTLAENTAYRADGLYAIAGRAESTGLAALLREFRFDMQSSGAWDGTGTGFRPQSYVDDVQTGRRISSVDMRWQSGAPSVLSRSPDTSEPWDIDPAQQTGTVDPLTALFALARSREEPELCDWSLELFDGRRRSRVSLQPTQPNGDTIDCVGVYTRVAGFSPDNMAEQTDFPFTAQFQRSGDLWTLTQVDLQSLYGAMRIFRTEN